MSSKAIAAIRTPPPKAVRSAAVRAGTFWINSYKTISVMSPFGGFKDSGYGRSSGLDGLLEYSQPKSIWTETSPDAPLPFGYGPPAATPG
jgi:aldehyde dehydrogenase (NAD+)